MGYDISKLKLVTVDHLSKSWDEPNVVEFYKKIISVKFKGYHNEFDSNVLPVDTTDYFAIHQAVCLPIAGELKPVMVYKTIPLSRCEYHKVTFPLLAIAQQSKSEDHIKAVSDIINAAKMNGRELGYTGCWTVDPEVRKDREFARALREIIMATYMQTHYGYGMQEHLVSATVRFQTDKLFTDYGHSLLKKNGVTLPSVRLHHLNDAEAVFMFVRQFSKMAHDIEKKWHGLWDDRIYYGPKTAPAKKQAA